MNAFITDFDFGLKRKCEKRRSLLTYFLPLTEVEGGAWYRRIDKAARLSTEIGSSAFNVSATLVLNWIAPVVMALILQLLLNLVLVSAVCFRPQWFSCALK